jgi:phosphotransferase system  glucose/maltose/N-acetylglucosamine-specific IIC component
MTCRTKTYKREVAFCMFLWIVWLSIMGPVGALEIVVWPVFAFMLGAFGLDEYNKNGNGSVIADLSGMLRPQPSVPADRRGSERSS